MRQAKHVTIYEFQNLMKETYFHRDKKRGIQGTLLWMVTEVGEFLDAVMKGEDVGDEAADVFAWLCSACNLLNVDLEEVSVAKYGAQCPRCLRKPGVCKDDAKAK